MWHDLAIYSAKWHFLCFKISRLKLKIYWLGFYHKIHPKQSWEKPGKLSLSQICVEFVSCLIVIPNLQTKPWCFISTHLIAPSKRTSYFHWKHENFLTAFLRMKNTSVHANNIQTGLSHIFSDCRPNLSDYSFRFPLGRFSTFFISV